MNRFHTIGRLAVILAEMASALLAFSAGAAPAALAGVMLPLGGDPHGRPGRAGQQPTLPAHAHTQVAGGMPGWQITLIAAGAALLAAVVVVVSRMRAARRVTVSAA